RRARPHLPVLQPDPGRRGDRVRRGARLDAGQHAHRQAAGRGDSRHRGEPRDGHQCRPDVSLHLHLRLAARGDQRGLHRADRVGGSGTGRRSDRAVVCGGGHRRPGKPPRCGARRGDGRPGALGRHPLPAAGRAVRDLPGDGDGARVQAARAVQHRRGEEDMSRDRTPRTLGLILLALLVSGQFLPQWTLFLVTVALAKGLVVLGLMILLRCGLVSFGQALYYCIGAYAAGMLGRLFGASDVFTLMLAGMAAAGLVGFVLGFLLARYRSIFFGLLSLAVSMILYGLLVKTEALGSTDGFHVLPSTLFGLRPADAWVRYTVLAVALLVAFIAALLVHRYLGTPLGRLASAIKDNEIRVEYMVASARHAILDAQGLNKNFGAVTAASDINAAIERDSVVGLIGTNGAGKTTFINMITGYLKPDRGRIRYEGRDITELAPRDVTRLGICRSF